MSYRILADENVELATVVYLRKLGHDVLSVGEDPELPLGVDDETLVTFCLRTNRLLLTQDDDFVTEFDPTETAGILYQRDQTLRSRAVGDIVHEISSYLEQETVVLEYISEEWL